MDSYTRGDGAFLASSVTEIPRTNSLQLSLSHSVKESLSFKWLVVGSTLSVSTRVVESSPGVTGRKGSLDMGTPKTL